MELEWRDPPELPAPGMRGHFEPVIVELRKKPGEWAVVRKYDQKASVESAVSNCRKRFKDCEFVSAPEGEKFVLFGRMKLHNPPKK